MLGKGTSPCDRYPARCSISLTSASSRLCSDSYEDDESRVRSEFCVVPDSVLLACISAIVARHWTAHAARLIACVTLESPTVIAAALHLRSLLLRWCHRHRLSTDHVPCISCIPQFASASTNVTAIFIISRAPGPDKVCLTPLYFISLLHPKPSQARLGEAALKSFLVLSRIRLPLDTSPRAIKSGNLTGMGRCTCWVAVKKICTSRNAGCRVEPVAESLSSNHCFSSPLGVHILVLYQGVLTRHRASDRLRQRLYIFEKAMEPGQPIRMFKIQAQAESEKELYKHILKPMAALTALAPVSAGWLSIQVHNRFRVRVEVLRKEPLTLSGTSHEIAPIPNEPAHSAGATSIVYCKFATILENNTTVLSNVCLLKEPYVGDGFPRMMLKCFERRFASEFGLGWLPCLEHGDEMKSATFVPVLCTSETVYDGDMDPRVAASSVAATFTFLAPFPLSDTEETEESPFGPIVPSPSIPKVFGITSIAFAYAHIVTQRARINAAHSAQSLLSTTIHCYPLPTPFLSSLAGVPR
ncbi:hypothetical protein F5141DRAFT_1066378 [Pisolithus sp. B1]|nr:hypothetical protein F5141DRAFT_1066378 [Pisolithus sp. B1]